MVKTDTRNMPGIASQIDQGKGWYRRRQSLVHMRRGFRAGLRQGHPAIGVLDSGVGGLTVVKEILRLLPGEPVVYLGDSARCPYGPRETEEIRVFTRQLVRHLQQTPLRALVLACNTATVAAIDELRQMLPYPVIGVIEPGARAAARQSGTGRIGLIATATTVRSGAHARLLGELVPGAQVFSVACPELVTLVEQQRLRGPETEAIIAQALTPLKDTGIDTLILGCTHFPLLAPAIQAVVGPDVALVNPAQETVQTLSLALRSICRPNRTPGSTPLHQFFTTGECQAFQQLGEEWLGMPLVVSQCTLPPSPEPSVLRREAWRGVSAPARAGQLPIVHPLASLAAWSTSSERLLHPS